jgi:hypothetical protein
MDLYRPRSHHEDARRLTHDLRTSDEPEWVAVRGFLTDAGFDPQECAVGDLFPEQSGQFGVVVTGDRRVFTFEVGWEPVRGERGERRWWVTYEERVDAEDRFAYAPDAFAAMTLLEAERPSGSRPLDVLVEYVGGLTGMFRGTSEKRWADRGEAEDYWDALHAFLRGRSIDPMKSVALAWAVRVTGGIEGQLLDIDGGLLDPVGECFHFTGSLQSINGPIGQVMAWDALDSSEAGSAYGDLVEAGLELLQRPQSS